MKLPLILFLVLGFSSAAHAACSGSQPGIPQAYESSALAGALADLNGFTYIRNQLGAWQAEGDTLCATGVALEKNIYQYYRWFIQIEVRSRSGELRALVPVLFQTASVQAHDNTGPKPWAVMPLRDTRQVLERLEFRARETLENFPRPEAGDFAAAVQGQAWAKEFDASSFSATPIGPDLFLVGWLALVPGTSGDFFTRQYAPRVVLLHYLAGGSVEVDPSHSGYGEVLAPLDTLLNSVAVPADTAARQELVRRFSESR